MNSVTVAVTGANGFVGRQLIDRLVAAGHRVRALTTSARHDFPPHIEVLQAPSDAAGAVWGEALQGVEVIVHLAGRAHVLREAVADPMEEFRRVNVGLTVDLARRAVAAGVRRFVFASSVGVHGTFTTGRAFAAAQPVHPTEPYAVSKWEAEQALRAIEHQSGLELTVLRLPLVYGPGVKGNFLRLLRLVDSGLPLPLGSVRNLRSYLGVDNLCDFVCRCLAHPAARGEVFLLADGEDLSTPALIERLAAAMQRRARLIAFPVPLLVKLTTMIGIGAEFRRLTSSLQVDASHARRTLDWSPATPVAAGLAAMAAWYVAAKAQERS